MYSVYQHWDKLKVCVIGKSYPPEFYSFISNSKLRSLFEKIAIETEEDFQILEKTLQNFGIKTIRPFVPKTNAFEHVKSGKRIPGPISMIPRDQMIMVGNTFYLYPFDKIIQKSNGARGLPKFTDETVITATKNFNWWKPILDDVMMAGNNIIDKTDEKLLSYLPTNGLTRCGKDLYFGTDASKQLQVGIKKIQKKYFENYRCHNVPTYGHMDGSFKPVVPGLIMSATKPNETAYNLEFPDWEVIYLPEESWKKTLEWEALKEKNEGKWFIKDHENYDNLVDFVNHWLKDWVGYVEETIFDVNMLMVDKKNVIVCGYNKVAYDAFEKYGITPHLVNLRHRYFWDGGIHCSTADLNREGEIKDYFPERG